MAEYIEREAAIAEVAMMAEDRRIPVDSYGGEVVGEVISILRRIPAADVVERASGIIGEIPTIDVRPVVRAQWYWDKDGMDWGIGAWRCSACNTMSPMWWNCDKGSPMHKSGHRFCPNCGADMREGI